MRAYRSCLVVVLLAVASALHAAETGSISGYVRADDGTALAGVTVSAVGDPLPLGRSAVTREDGGFDILRLPPGEYRLTAELQGVGTAEVPVIVAVDRDTQVEVALTPQVAEEITVSAAAPVIDTRSSEVEVNFTQEVIENLPVQRDYKGLFQLSPGVSENGRLTPNAGGARMDNNFLLDGVTITNPHYGDIVPNVSGIDIAEVNLKRAGITAEFGRTGGMVVNAVTRSGTNDFQGRARVEFRPADWTSDSDLASLQNTTDRESIGAALGGPILRDRVWFYGSASFPELTTTDRRNNLGAVPDRVEETDEYFLKLTAQPSESIYLSGAVRTRDTETANSGILASTHPSVATTDTTEYLIATALGTWNLTPRSFLEGRLNRNDEDNSGVPITDVGYRPAFNPARPDLVGQFTTATGLIVGGATAAGQTVGAGQQYNFQNFLRDEARVAFQSFQEWFGRRHDLRVGATWEEAEEELDRRANGWGLISFSTTSRLFTATYVSIQPPHTARSETQGLFVQDEIDLSDRSTLMLGLLANRDVYFGEVFNSSGGKDKKEILTFDWSDQIQPRLGFTFVPDRQLGDRLFVALGRYMNTENKSLGRAASPTRIFTTRATFNEAGVLLSDVPAANTQTKTVDSNLQPMYTDEITAGYARPLGDYWSAEVWGIYREVGDIFEDISRDGLGNGPFRVAQLPDAYREYTAVTLQGRRAPVGDRLMGLWVDASYTWSELKGNWDIDYADSLFFNSSILHDGPGVLVGDNRDGLLRGDRTHVAKLFATIAPLESLRVGSYVRYQSGGAWERRGQPSTNVSSAYHRYLEPAGSQRMEDWLNVDLLASYHLPLGPVGLELEGRVINLFDEQVELQVDDRWVLNRPLNPADPGPSPLLSPSNNPAFGTATVLSDPRAYVVSATLTF